MAQDDIQELQEALSWIESIARSLGNRHQALTDEVRLAGQANKRLNAIYRAAIETEDEITRLAQDLGKFQSGLCIFEDLQEDLKDSRSDLEDLEKIQATAREELREFRMYELAYDIERQHQKKAC